jgi:hypothetical protein
MNAPPDGKPHKQALRWVPRRVWAYGFAFGLCVVGVVAGVGVRVFAGPGLWAPLGAAAIPLLLAHAVLAFNTLTSKSVGLRWAGALGGFGLAVGGVVGLFVLLFEEAALGWHNYPNFFWMFFLCTLAVWELAALAVARPASTQAKGKPEQTETAA